MLKRMTELDPKDYTVAERRELVARSIEIEPERFDMGVLSWTFIASDPDCESDPDFKTVGCIAAWTCYLFARDVWRWDVASEAADILGLDRTAADDLFYAVKLRDEMGAEQDRTDIPLEEITPTQAAAMIRALPEPG